MKYYVLLILFFIVSVFCICAMFILKSYLYDRKQLRYAKLFEDFVDLQDEYFDLSISGKFVKYEHINEYLASTADFVNRVIEYKNFTFDNIVFEPININDDYVRLLFSDLKLCVDNEDQDVLGIFIKKIEIINKLVKTKQPVRYFLNKVKKIFIMQILYIIDKIGNFIKMCMKNAANINKFGEMFFLRKIFREYGSKSQELRKQYMNFYKF